MFYSLTFIEGMQSGRKEGTREGGRKGGRPPRVLSLLNDAHAATTRSGECVTERDRAGQGRAEGWAEIY